MATNDLVDDDLWAAIQPLVPAEPCTTHGDPPRRSPGSPGRHLYIILRHSLRWRDLLRVLSYGSGSTRW